MAEIKVAFWNLQNLFDVEPNEIFSDFEFTRDAGWDQAAFDAKVGNLAKIIRGMHGGAGPDLLGVAEIENEEVARKLLDKIGRADLRLATYVDAPDLRGIDVALFYSADVFKSPPDSVTGHMVHMRYPTRDIFEVHLALKTGQELLVFVNHWPSRSEGQYETEPARITVAERCGSLVDAQLKVDRATFMGPPEPTLLELNRRWDRNVLLMGDFNDEPYDRSVLHYLQASKDLDHLEEPIKAKGSGPLPDRQAYLGRQAYLFNCMWPLLGTPDRGSYHLSEATNSMNLLDQFMVSRGLYYGSNGLKLDTGSVAIFQAKEMTTSKGRPIPFDLKKKKGFSDHFPVTAVVRTV